VGTSTENGGSLFVATLGLHVGSLLHIERGYFVQLMVLSIARFRQFVREHPEVCPRFLQVDLTPYILGAHILFQS
jgi:hypothetical protein